jgi:hypothetical protein
MFGIDVLWICMSCGGEPCWAYVVFMLRDLLLSWQLGKGVWSLRVGEGSCERRVEGEVEVMLCLEARTVRVVTEA